MVVDATVDVVATVVVVVVEVDVVVTDRKTKNGKELN